MTDHRVDRIYHDANPGQAPELGWILECSCFDSEQRNTWFAGSLVDVIQDWAEHSYVGDRPSAGQKLLEYAQEAAKEAEPPTLEWLTFQISQNAEAINRLIAARGEIRISHSSASYLDRELPDLDWFYEQTSAEMDRLRTQILDWLHRGNQIAEGT